MQEALTSAQTAAREMVVEVDHRTVGTVPLVGIPFRLFGTPSTIRRAPPTLGQHSREILAEELGMDQTQIDGLVAAGITSLDDDGDVAPPPETS